MLIFSALSNMVQEKTQIRLDDLYARQNEQQLDILKRHVFAVKPQNDHQETNYTPENFQNNNNNVYIHFICLSPHFCLGNMPFVELRHMFILVALTHNITKISFIVPVYNFYVVYVIQLLYVCTYCSLTGYVFTTIFRQSLFLLYQETSRTCSFYS